MTNKLLWLGLIGLLFSLGYVQAAWSPTYWSSIDYPASVTNFPSHGTGIYGNYQAMAYGIYGGGNYQHFYSGAGRPSGYLRANAERKMMADAYSREFKAYQQRYKSKTVVGYRNYLW